MQIAEELFIEYKDDICSYLVYFTGDFDVEDLVQEVFVKLLKNKTTLTKVSHPKALLFTIARNVAIDNIRKRKLRNLLQLQLKKTENMSDKSSPDVIIESREKVEQIIHSLNHLSSEYRHVMILRKIKGFSIEETASILGWSESKVKTCLHRAMKKLRSKLAVENGGDPLYERNS